MCEVVIHVAYCLVSFQDQDEKTQTFGIYHSMQHNDTYHSGVYNLRQWRVI